MKLVKPSPPDRVIEIDADPLSSTSAPRTHIAPGATSGSARNLIAFFEDAMSVVREYCQRSVGGSESAHQIHAPVPIDVPGGDASRAGAGANRKRGAKF
jgi:hypothetical protein